jgi:hypothetical protein
MGMRPTGIETLSSRSSAMTNLRKTLFAVALTALTGSALAATPAAAPASPATPAAPAAKTMPAKAKHKHVAKVKKEDAKSKTQKAGIDGGKG